MKQSIFFGILTALVALSGCAAHGGHMGAHYAPSDTGIVVAGEGRAEAAPDIAIIRVGIEARRPTMAEARTAHATAQTRVIEAVRGLGVVAADVQTDQLSMQADYDYAETGRVLRGYIATSMLRVRMREVARAGEVVDATITAGGDDARVDGVAFEIEDQTTLRAEARRRAVADARVKAEQLASEIGATVGDPVFIEETSAAMPGPVMMRMEAASADARTPIEAGSLETRVEVRVRWSIRR